jgi:predicted transcriptional regulator
MIDTSVVLKTKRGSSVPKDRVVKQIGLPDEDQKKLKHYALDNDKEIQEVTDEAILEFFDGRDEKIKRKERPEYNLSPKDSELFSTRLDPKVAAKVDKVAKEDGATARRIIYTGLREFIKKHGL